MVNNIPDNKRILKILNQSGINSESFEILDTKGYGSYVYVLKVEENKLVYKLYKDFSPYKNLPFYSKKRISIDLETFAILENIKSPVTPKVYSFDKEYGDMLMEYIDPPFLLLEDSFISKNKVKSEFFINFANFLYKKSFIKNININFFYDKRATFELRTLFVPKEYIPYAVELFNLHVDRTCICLAGLSPKNIFVYGDDFRLIDFEEAFLGDFLYDYGYFIGHTLLYNFYYPNSLIITGLQEFINTAIHLEKLNSTMIAKIYKYAGLMLLHRAEGFNLNLHSTEQKDKIIYVGGQMLKNDLTVNDAFYLLQ